MKINVHKGKIYSFLIRKFSVKPKDIIPIHKPEESQPEDKNKIIEIPKEEKVDLNKIMDSLDHIPSLYHYQKIKKQKKEYISIQELIHSREFSFGALMLMFKNYDLALETFTKLKHFVYRDYLSSPVYTMIIRRLGLACLKTGHIKEGIMEIENVDEFANEKDNFGSDYKFNAQMDRLRVYIYYDPLRAVDYSDYLFTLKQRINNLEREQLATLYLSAAVAYFINFARPFEEIKTMIRKAINFHRDPYFKANAISNLAVILYYECKIHNENVDKEKERKKNEQKMFEENEINKLLGDVQEIDEGARYKRKVSENDKKMIKKMKMELEDFKIDEKNVLKDKQMKAYARQMYFEEKKLQKMLSKPKNNEENKEFLEKLNVLHKSKLPVGIKVSPIEYNIDRYKEINIDQEINKIISSQVDYENDLDSILGNIFIAFKLYEMVHNIKLQNDRERGKQNLDPYIRNFSKNSDFTLYIKRNEEYRKMNKIELTQDELDEFKKNFNVDNICLDFSTISSFEELMEKDLFQTAIKNPLSFKSILFLAEIYTEYSRKYKNESEFWIKYSLNMLFKFKTNLFNYRALTLLGAYLMDTDDIKRSKDLLNFLIKRNEIEEEDPLTYNMIQLLYGILMKLDPKTKGEGLELIERVQHIKENLQIEEKMFHIHYDDFHLGSDIEPQYLKDLLGIVSKLEDSGMKL